MSSALNVEDRSKLTSTWRENILQEVDRVQSMLDRSGAASDEKERADRALQLASRAATQRRDSLSSLWAGWSGADIERAWRSLHRAKQELFLLAKSEDIRSQLPALRSKVESSLSSTIERKRYEAWLAEMEKEGGTLERERLREIRTAVDRQSDQQFESIRRFRNALWGALLGAILLLAVLAFGSGWVPGLPLCGSTAAAATEEVSGITEPTLPEECVPVWQVELVGAAGALIAAAAAFWEVPKSGEPFGLRGIQSLVKVPMGALTAVIGTMLLQSGVIDALDPQPVPEVLAYAALFGFAQQVVTRFIDSRAATLLKGPQKAEKERSA
jgi:hypothetical protein